MTLYNHKSFTVPASAGSKTICGKVGHAWADTRGKCVRCGDKIRPDPYQDLPTEYQKDTEPA